MNTPDGHVLVSFSGGRTSGYMLRLLLDQLGGALPDNWRVVFTNTGREMPQTLDFVQECADRWNVPVTWLEWVNAAPGWVEVNHNSAARDGEPFAALIDKKGFPPNVMARYCTVELKIRLVKKYLQQGLGWPRYTSALGIRADEPKRVKDDYAADRERPPETRAMFAGGKRKRTGRGRGGRDSFDLWYPLVERGVTVHDVAAFWRAQEFDLTLPNINGRTWLGNCDGCFLKRESALAALVRQHPERAKWWEDVEAKTGTTFHQDVPRKDLREFVERQGDLAFAMDDEGGGLFCQADHGECTG